MTKKVADMSQYFDGCGKIHWPIAKDQNTIIGHLKQHPKITPTPTGFKVEVEYMYGEWNNYMYEAAK